MISSRGSRWIRKDALAAAEEADMQKAKHAARACRERSRSSERTISAERSMEVYAEAGTTATGVSAAVWTFLCSLPKEKNQDQMRRPRERHPPVSTAGCERNGSDDTIHLGEANTAPDRLSRCRSRRPTRARRCRSPKTSENSEFSWCRRPAEVVALIRSL